VDSGSQPGRDTRRRYNDEDGSNRDQCERPPGRDDGGLRRIACDSKEAEVQPDAKRNGDEGRNEGEGGVGADARSKTVSSV
jgi:hypothetical protein